MSQIRCPIRGRWVAATPEEKVRQRLIHLMIGNLGFPKGLMAVEKDLRALPSSISWVERRLDLICYALGKEGIAPLLIVECKSESLNEAAQRQLLGYNQAIRAPFLCLANGSGMQTFWQEGNLVVSIPFLPSYAQLVEKRCLS